ncbi:P-type cation-transporting ATPase [Colletotrichum spinosum]|uniref:P-type cation-transporting ATPase n=1 Tax=Colletotrichum spinosum TaxID=1347390 RepID=A0A4R8QNB0_9PEZI|nr:P-type cation-transporting ATPase [Colletotrichum spinosum]
MGSGCCSGGLGKDRDGGRPSTGRETAQDGEHQHGSNSSHQERGDGSGHTCPDDTPFAGGESDASDTVNGSLKLACCTSHVGKCNGCNDECIIAVAAAECEKICDDDDAHEDAADHKHTHDKNGQHAEACETHVQQAIAKYKAYLDTARCICRTVLDRHLPTTCCSEQQTSPASAATSVSSSVAPKKSYPATRARSPSRARGQQQHHDHQGVKSHSKKAQAHAVKPAQDGQPGCCSGHPVSQPSDPLGIQPRKYLDGETDIERNAALEYVSLVVDGMDCSGCSNALEDALKAVPGVTGVRVNFVMSTAEFRCDEAIGKAQDAIRHAESLTGFRCTRKSSHDQNLDVLSSAADARTLLQLELPGVSSITLLNKNMVRLSYDPAVTGARTLFERTRPYSTGLAPPRDDPSIAMGRKRMRDKLIKTILAAVLTIPICVFSWGQTDVDIKTKSIVSLVLASHVQLIAVPEFYKPALSTLIRARKVEMDMLVVISITAAYTYSLVAFGYRMANRDLKTKEYFETSTLLITLVLLGRMISAISRIRAVSAVSVRSLQAATAFVVENGSVVEVDARLLQYGDIFRLLPETVVPTDGLVTEGVSEVDESMLTGENKLVPKKPGDHIIAGTVNGPGTLTVQLMRLPGKNTVTDIAKQVEDANNSKPKCQDVADRVAGWFVIVVPAIAVVVMITQVLVGLYVRISHPNEAFVDALNYAIAVLVISCPCAMGLAVPMVLVIAIGVAAKGGVIIKSAEAIERARGVTAFVFDKTGTITDSDLDVCEEKFLVIDENRARAIAGALVAGNKHPVSLAIANYLTLPSMPEIELSSLHSIPGSGVEAELEGHTVRAGSPAWTGSDSLPFVTQLQNRGMTLLVVTEDSKPIIVYGLTSHIRHEAYHVIPRLRSLNFDVHLVSGDQEHAVQAVAEEIGISNANVAFQQSPAQKREYVSALMSKGKVVMFVGDGTNDAVAVAQANIGVQIASVLCSSDVTRSAADVVLFSGLEGILSLIHVSKRAHRRIAFNFFWAGFYNLFAILLASGAFPKFHIPPAYAGLGELVSVMPVVVAALTMLH